MASSSDHSVLPTAVDETPVTRSLISLLFDHVRIDDAVLNHAYQGKGTPEHPYIVSWISNDSGNPFNWSKASRWRITMISAVTCFAVAFSSSAYTGMSASYLLHDFSINR